MKNIQFLLSITLVANLLFVSCEDDDNQDNTKPTVTELEVGHDGEAHIGEALHLEFYVEDNDLLDYYSVEIHGGEEGQEESEITGWKYEEEFTEIRNKKNYTVHHHGIMIPETVEEGEYHFHLRVVDMSGNVTEIEEHLHATHEEVEDDHDHVE
ncbi:DUF4625 domain-containing protein [Plebeiibacterium sediminum]|uniref:DUF4625 domain-containing protein n=1 Tax=Plebeiibacterium sediminum TaxID=2992112 RepID=A0AAE3M0W4_9BACT|nr:DUF4625 domain-containing protein [Plebeiobacterium sediminum]MCW3785201.1 DUF4625 domain-containing protein [Plebeiobacterium sediminum]